MLPSDPNWLSADAALWAAIFAGLSFLATVGGIIVAVIALRWARTAAKEAGKQAIAALNSAEAARAQTSLLERQIVLSEPQPVVILSITFSAGGGGRPILEVQNVGEQLAFDIEVSDLSILTEVPEARVVSAASFNRVPVLKKDTKCEPQAKIDRPPKPKRNITPDPRPELTAFLEELVWQTERNLSASSVSGRDERLALGSVQLDYKNARGRPYKQLFGLYAGPAVVGLGSRALEFVSEGSLVERLAAGVPNPGKTG